MKESIKKLKELEFKRQRELYPNLPEHAIYVPAYTDKNNKELLKCIKAYLRVLGHHYETLEKSEIIYSQKTKKDVIGRQRIVGNNTYSKSTTSAGNPDISFNLDNQSYLVEVNTKSMQHKPHLVVNSLEQFMDWHESIEV